MFDWVIEEEHGFVINHVRCVSIVIPILMLEPLIGCSLLASFLSGTGELMRKLALNGGSISIHGVMEANQTRVLVYSVGTKLPFVFSNFHIRNTMQV